VTQLNTSQIGQDLPIFDELSDNLLPRDAVASAVITAAPETTSAPDVAKRSESQNWGESI